MSEVKFNEVKFTFEQSDKILEAIKTGLANTKELTREKQKVEELENRNENLIEQLESTTKKLKAYQESHPRWEAQAEKILKLESKLEKEIKQREILEKAVRKEISTGGETIYNFGIRKALAKVEEIRKE